jgi:hypothetical protein
LNKSCSNLEILNSARGTVDTPDTPAPRASFRTVRRGPAMKFTTAALALALVGYSVGQPAQPIGPDYFPMNSRTIKLPIEYKKDRKSIRQVLLYVARNGENTWYQEAFVTPDKDHFVYVAKDDGIYWFKMVIEDLKGNKDPVDVTRDPPDLKMLIDTTPPAIRVTNAKRTGDDVVIEWAIEDKFPTDAEPKVQFRAMNNPLGYWTDVKLPANSRTGVAFKCGPDAVTVRIVATDLAGNRNEATRDFPTGSASTSLAPPNTPVLPSGPSAPSGPTIQPPADLVPPIGPLSPAPPAPPIQPPVSTQPTQPIYTQPTQPQPGSMQPLAVVDPKAPPALSGAQPAAAWNTGTPAAPPPELPRAQAVRFTRFDLGYDLEQRGPSGISRVDLWVTRDDGRSWNKWSQHDGKGGSVRVVLDVRENAKLEGLYGFRLVPVSGAGLSEREPVAGDAPDLRVTVDVTAPQIDLFPLMSDPNAPETLLVQWKASDSNFGDDPITLEWSDAPNGPWHPVASNGEAPVVQATALNAPVARKLANTGQYAWKVPAGVPARVYLKATARDAAGNVKEVVTREPQLVDLTKPRAKINGIVPAVVPRQ